MKEDLYEGSHARLKINNQITIYLFEICLNILYLFSSQIEDSYCFLVKDSTTNVVQFFKLSKSDILKLMINLKNALIARKIAGILTSHLWMGKYF
ncbi:hypothetical protein BpHYR1_036269 [Brachionus plicatilis]|uniref:Uncharacterized protein n=1 Tax=Brachionus plicatilis TaxID=10195 RepID=A0A3M7PII6_BRAPC|nr:hypothetical protein BpHYR1_036269 [Brachionus plicatilis]